MNQPVIVDNADDPRLEDYVDLTDVELRTRVEPDGGFFIAESPHVIRTVIGAGAPMRSFLVTEAQYEALRDVLDAATAPVYLTTPAVMRRVVGFDLHRGAVASVTRPSPRGIETVVEGAGLLAVLERVNDHENLGGVFRNAAAFGVDGVLLDPECADPLYRRSVRVSIGHVCTVPWTRVPAWPDPLTALRNRGFVVAALTPAGEQTVDELAQAANPKVALLLGAEGPGLSAAALAAADVRVRIAMASGVDSLNVATAAAVAFHACSRANAADFKSARAGDPTTM